MKRVITYGTFDILHYGHIDLLKALGIYLIAVCSSDDFNTLKNKKSYYDFEHRKLMLESIRFVDLVVPENDWEQKSDYMA
jgi:glycerol-3-phosphate cytidylyltransferase